MTSYPDLYDENIIRSLYKYIKDTFGTLYTEYGIDYGQEGFVSTSFGRWIRISPESFGSGTHTTNSFTVECFSVRSSDKHRTELEKMIGRFRECLNVSGGIPFLDFVTNRTTPTPILFSNTALNMAVRFGTRNAIGEGDIQSNEIEGIALLYYVYVGRPSSIN